MKVWTYAEAKAKLELDEDLQDEDWISSEELVGYFNDAIDEAEAEIHKIHEDYFLTNDTLTLVSGTGDYDCPEDIYSNKFRGVVYANGSTIYEVPKIRQPANGSQFVAIAVANQYPGSQLYAYKIYTPDSVTGYQMKFVPTPQEDGAYITRWYLREATRIPLLDEYFYQEAFLTAAVDATANTVTHSGHFDIQTGEKVKFTGTLPSPLAVDTFYWAIRISATVIKLAASAALATAGTALDLTTTGSGGVLRLHGTLIRQNLMLIDIPDFVSFVVALTKARCLAKDGGDPRLQLVVADLENQRKLMVETLTGMIPDDNDTVPADLSHYEEHS